VCMDLTFSKMVALYIDASTRWIRSTVQHYY
jgi:hypothetical protein